MLDAAPAPRAAHILMVEDDILVREVMAEVLRENGFAVVEASSADEAWSYLEFAAEQVDLVFSDVRMPGSMDGVELAQRIKDRYTGIEVLLTSGYVGERYARDNCFYLAKPYPPRRAVTLIEDILSKGFRQG